MYQRNWINTMQKFQTLGSSYTEKKAFSFNKIYIPGKQSES